jgi:hypothetical protein
MAAGNHDTNGDRTMRFLGYTMGDDSMFGETPSPEMFEKMDAFIGEATKAGVILATGGMAPIADGIQVTLADGEFTVVDGPFAEAKELVGGWALMEVRDRDEAIEWTKRFLAVGGGGQTRLREVFGPD